MKFKILKKTISLKIADKSCITPEFGQIYSKIHWHYVSNPTLALKSLQKTDSQITRCKVQTCKSMFSYLYHAFVV